MPRFHVKITLFLLQLLSLIAVTASAEEGKATLRDIKLIATTPSVQLEITADKPLNFSAYTMPPMLRGVIDLKDTYSGNLKTYQKMDAPPLISLYMQPKILGDQRIIRLVLNLQRDMDLKVTPHMLDKGKLIVTLLEKSAGNAQQATSDDTPSTKKGVNNEPSPLPKPKTRREATAPVKTEKSRSMPLKPVVPSPSDERLVTGIKISDGGFEVLASQLPENFNSFTLTGPGRLVIDIPQTKSSIPKTKLPLNSNGVQSVRIGSYPDKLRLVFDAGSKSFPPYEIVRGEKGLRILLTGGKRAK